MIHGGFQCRIVLISLFLLTTFLMPLQPAIPAEEGKDGAVSPVSNSLGIALAPEEQAWLDAHASVKASGPRAFPPFHYFDENGNARGIALDYLRFVMGRIGLRTEAPEDLPWPEVMRKAREGETDLVSCIARTPDREAYLLFSNPFLSFPLVIVSRNDAPFIGGLNDLRGMKVAFVRQNSVYDWIERDGVAVAPHFVDSPLEALKAVSSGLAEAHIENLAAAGYLIEHHGLTNLKVAAPTSYGNYELHFAVRKDWPELVSLIDKALAEMSPEQHAAIRNKWLSVRYEHGISRLDVVRWILTVVFVSSLVMILLLVSNRRLKREAVERARAEKSLRESEEKMRSIFRAAPVGIGMVVNRVITEANVRISEMTGYTREELIGSSSRMLYPTEDEYEYVGREKYLQISKQGLGTVETRWKRSDGALVDVLLSSAPLDVEDLSRGVTFTALDITELKRAEEDKDRLRSRLAQVQKMEAVGRLAGGIAHDFNNILQIILGYVDLALLRTEQSSPIYQMLRKIRDSARRSADLVRQLLAFARKQPVSLKVLDVNETVEGMLNMLRRLIGENVELLWKPGPDLFPVKMDPAQIDQVLANLCINARDAIRGVGKITIETDNVVLDEAYCGEHAGFIPGEFVLLAVSDNGCGMSKEVLDNLFEPFFTTKGLGKGTGLGLATVYGIVKQNNGFINVYSEPDRGTTFKVYLPRTRVHASKEDAFQGEKTETEELRGTETILLVEDEESILALGKSALETYGYLVLPARGPVEALSMAETHSGRLHLLITDVVMPGMNGKELGEKLTALRPGVKCIFMSGYTANVIAHHGVLDEGIHFLQKPFSVNTLVEKVREVLGS